MIYTIQTIIMLTALPIITYLTVNQAIKLFSFGLDTKTINKKEISFTIAIAIFGIMAVIII